MSWVTSANQALLTDFYELTMAASYLSHGMDRQPATFDLFVRGLPEQRNFLVACGLEQALQYLEELRFEPDDLDYLRSLGVFSDDALQALGRLRFSGDVWAVPEGEVVFAQEPLLRVTAPLIEAQIVETFLLNCVLFQTMVASKAARIALACGERASFVDFSARRDHAADAALKGARAAVVGGATGTSNTLAARLFNIPPSGTMAHSFVLGFEHEADAFRAFGRDFPDRSIVLIDTYDTLEGARRAAAVSAELARDGGQPLRGVRLDSGDFLSLSRGVRHILDAAGQTSTRIFVSGDMDEYRIAELLDAGAPIDAFGVGTQLGTSGDAPTLSGVYKLTQDVHGPRMKLSTGKATLPGCKQVFRHRAGGQSAFDVIALADEDLDGEPLLRPVMRAGRRLQSSEPLSVLSQRRAAAVAALPAPQRSLTARHPYPVHNSPALDALIATVSATRH